MKLSTLLDKARDLENEMRKLQLQIANSILIESQNHLTAMHIESYQEAYRKYNKLLDSDIRKAK